MDELLQLSNSNCVCLNFLYRTIPAKNRTITETIITIKPVPFEPKHLTISPDFGF